MPLLLAGLFFFATLDAQAHQDRLFPLLEDGSIGELPKGYGPGALTITESAVTLTLGRHENRLVKCLVPVFQLPEGESVALHGSAHHDLEHLPPYLAIDLPQDSLGPGGFNGYQLLFHLGTAKLLEMHRMEVTPGPEGSSTGTTLRRIPAFSELCGGPEPRIGEKPETCTWFRRLIGRCR